jgi:hypothetical protein
MQLYDRGDLFDDGSNHVEKQDGSNFVQCFRIYGGFFRFSCRRQCRNAVRHSNGGRKTYIQAWYTANNSNSNVSDRWLGYVREGSSIVEYSARTGNTPSKSADTFSYESENVMVAGSLLSDTRTFDSEFGALTYGEYTMIDFSELFSEFYRKSPEFLAKTDIEEERAREVALDWLPERLPADAQLETVSPIYAAVDDDAPKVVAYVLRYGRRVNDLPILTNGRAIYYEVLVNDDEVAASSMRWPKISSEPVSRPELTLELMPVSDALENAVEAIDEIAKYTIKIVDVEACLGLSDDHLVPAYAFMIDDGAKIVVDARTADLLE